VKREKEIGLPVTGHASRVTRPGAVRAALLGLILMVGTALPSAAYDVVEVRNGGMAGDFCMSLPSMQPAG